MSAQPPPQPKADLASLRWQKPGCLMLGAAALVGIVGLAVGSDTSLKWLRYALFGLAAVGALVGTVVTLIGMVIATREQLQEGRDL